MLKPTKCLWLGLCVAMAAGCRHDHLPSLSTGGTDYSQVNLVADTAGFQAARIDSVLDNPWGIAISPKGSIWISCNHSGQTVIYDANGNQSLAPVAIPLNGNRFGSSPVGVVYNGTTDFTVNGKAARFIYATEDGIIAAWAGGDSTITVADRSAAGAVYKGITIANDGTGNFLYVTDFYNSRIDVFDKSFSYVGGKPFADSTIPQGFAPFNIRNINGNLFVVYAKQKAPDNHDDQSGPGNGYIDIYSPSGILRKRFASQGSLNSPWGIVQPPPDFGQPAGSILVGNFGDGRILVYDSTGNLKGPIENNGIPLYVAGVWDIAFSPAVSNQLFFTAGPSQETYGVFGYLKPK